MYLEQNENIYLGVRSTQTGDMLLGVPRSGTIDSKEVTFAIRYSNS